MNTTSRPRVSSVQLGATESPVCMEGNCHQMSMYLAFMLTEEHLYIGSVTPLEGNYLQKSVYLLCIFWNRACIVHVYKRVRERIFFSVHIIQLVKIFYIYFIFRILSPSIYFQFMILMPFFSFVYMNLREQSIVYT